MPVLPILTFYGTIKVNTRLKLRGQVCPNGVKGHTEASRDTIISKKMLYGSKIRDSGLDRKLKFSDNFCQFFPEGLLCPFFLKFKGLIKR